MDRLWAPWRKNYVSQRKPLRGCIFCRAHRSSIKKDGANLLLYRSTHSFILLNRYPYNNGHLMIAPNRHVNTLEKLAAKERLNLLELLDLALQLLRKAFHPEGFNLGLNLGRTGGAGVPGHVHLHVVPRWKGDTNFMPIIARTKVISDSLQEVYRSLHRLIPR